VVVRTGRRGWCVNTGSAVAGVRSAGRGHGSRGAVRADSVGVADRQCSDRPTDRLDVDRLGVDEVLRLDTALWVLLLIALWPKRL